MSVRRGDTCRNQRVTKKRQEAVFLQGGEIFIYNTWCWQGISSSASILQGWSARLRMYCAVFGNQDCSGTINTRLKQQTRSLLVFFFWLLFFFFIFFYKMVQTTIQNICAVDNLQKKSFDSITVQFFLKFFSLISSIWNNVTMVHQNAFWTAAPVMRAATLFEM